MTTDLTPKDLLRVYACGIFPMAQDRHGADIQWVEPRIRGVLPLDDFHISRRLARTVRQNRFQIRIDKSFRRVIEACAEASPDRESTWINDEIIELFSEVHRLGNAHSVECWRDGSLVGGLYGIALGGAFFGESMFSRQRDASKVALVHLAARLRWGGFILLDTQFVTEHLERFGVLKVPHEDFHDMLEPALAVDGDFAALPDNLPGARILEIIRGGPDGGPGDHGAERP